MKINTNISNNLTSEEKELFSVLKNVVKEKTPSTVLRVAGGWCRDKVWGLNPIDIDIMVDNISGEQMARLVTDYLNIGGAHTIRSNPAKSKFLETATATIPLSSGKTIQVDFAQARQDVYRENSRIPEIKLATPMEDSFRRDLTINSLFYNLMTNKLEDFTKKGIQDLISNTIRTPLDPLKTFSDDPLRIFRTIRLAAKYNSKIDDATYKAMSNPLLRDAIRRKLSVERIGAEFEKMIKNPNAQKAIEMLKDTELLQDIIAESIRGTEYEGKMADLEMNQENPNHKLNLWLHTMEVVKVVLEKYKEAEPEKRMVMILSALFHDIGKLYRNVWAESKSHAGHRSYIGHEEASSKIVELILKYLKIENYIKQVVGITSNHMRPHSLVRDEGGIRAMRRFIRIISDQSLEWLDVFNIAVADAYAKDVIQDPNVVRDYQDLELKLQEALSSIGQLQDPSKKKIDPILNGNEIMNYFNNRKSGVWIKTVMNWLLDLQDQEPNITKEDAQKRMIENFPEFVNKTITASKCSRILIDSTINKINKVIKEKPVEAVSLAKDLMEDHNDDEDVVLLCLKTAIKAKEIDHTSLIGSDLVNIGRKMAKKNFLVPEIILNYVIALILSGQEIKDEDKEFLLRAKKMSPEKTRRSIKDILDISGNNKGILKKVLNEDN
jgi:tRNA nucleotidyltransferase (CCA-adding enzyme)